MKKLALLACTAALTLATSAFAGEKGLMHCFAFTVIDTASDAEWQAFAEATDALPAKVKVVKHVWHGKLMRPLGQFAPDAETRKKIKPDTKEVEGKFARMARQHGVCMWLEDEAALKTYSADPYHAEWSKAYEKVRVAGTTTYDIVAK